MQRNKQSFIFLLVCHALTVLLIGCEKEGLRNKSYSGAVTNLTTGEAAMGAKVQLVEEHVPSEPLSPVIQNVLQYTTTDASGFFEFEPIQKEKRNRDYFVRIEEGWFYADHGWQNGDYENVVSSVLLEKGSTLDLELEVVPLGEFELIIDLNTADSIHLRGTINNGLIEMVLIDLDLHGGQYIQSTNIRMPSDDYDVVWEVTDKGGAKEIFHETFHLPFAQEVELLFNHE